MSIPNNMTIRQDLTDYAHGLMQDLEPIMRVAELLAPVVPTGASTGLFNKFDDTQAFKAYAAIAARRAVGGKATAIAMLTTTDTYNLNPYALRIAIDQIERSRAGGAVGLLEKGKTRTLQVNCAVAYLNEVVTIAKAAVAAMANKGDWGNANVNPIAEINDAVKAVFLATGIVPNTVLIDFGAWCVLSGNPNVLKAMPGADLATVTPDRVARLLVNPAAKVEIVNTAALTGGGLGNSGATKQGILGGSVLVLNNSPVPTEGDPSFMKTFAETRDLFTGVYSYREEPHLDWYENDWTCQPKVVAAGLCKRIDVTGANS
jgi:hypothetical protein